MSDMGIVGFLVFLLYFAPAIIADKRKHPNWRSIVAVNILLGWTFIGWVVALVWSVSAIEPPRGARGATGFY